ncbi:type II toxin-antitoxin system CcdA family antitoxin [Streptomyces paludis]|uniref:CopG family transcriptional regulator n=1 Tax=Streptomyces paludis TaxID=2282738 RepID=A0A345HM46_9ACTN|nr:type II toxin-antitoxin system CcdA family antitoxin [Streptomyces paludis]AXG77770.1 hypothetical protein DVK44_08745 [Streptomyces paludis]
MATKKITITLPEELVKAAKGFTDNLSGYAAEALARRIRNELLSEEIRRYEEEHGAFTEEEQTEADAILHGWLQPDANPVQETRNAA